MVVIVLALLTWGVFALRAANARDWDRTELKIEIDTMKQTCTPDAEPEFLDINTDAFEKHVAASSLDFDEKRMLVNVWENNLAVCRARSKVKLSR
jgi:hypothetical protein